MILLLKKLEKLELWRSGRGYTWNGLCLEEMQGVIFWELIWGGHFLNSSYDLYFQLFFPVPSNSFKTHLVTDTTPNQHAYICLFQYM